MFLKKLLRSFGLAVLFMILTIVAMAIFFVVFTTLYSLLLLILPEWLAGSLALVLIGLVVLTFLFYK